MSSLHVLLSKPLTDGEMSGMLVAAEVLGKPRKNREESLSFFGPGFQRRKEKSRRDGERCSVNSWEQNMHITAGSTGKHTHPAVPGQ